MSTPPDEGEFSPDVEGLGGSRELVAESPEPPASERVILDRLSRIARFVLSSISLIWQLIWLRLARACRWTFGLDLKEAPAGKARDGAGIFIALASFAVAEGTALTVVAKEEKSDKIVLGIYGIIVALTVFWIIAMLRTTNDEPDPSNPHQTVRVRAIDRASLRYGYFTLVWAFLLAGVMVFLAWNRLLPNQTARVAYTDDDIKFSEPVLLVEKRQGSLASRTGEGINRAALDVWVRWLADAESDVNAIRPREGGKSEPVRKRLVWFEKKAPFPDYYKSFAARIDHGKDYVLVEPVAFLVGRADGSPRPVYRQLAFRLEGGKPTDVFDLDEPDAGESVVVLSYIRRKDNGEISQEPRHYGLKVVRSH